MKSPESLFLTSYISESKIDEITKRNGEPEWIKTRRLEAFKKFKELPIDQDNLFYKYTDFKNFDPEKLKPFWEMEVEEIPSTQSLKIAEMTPTFVESVEKVEISLGHELKEDSVFLGTLGQLASQNENLAKKIVEEVSETMDFDKLGNLATAYSAHTLVLFVPKNFRSEKPILKTTLLSGINVAMFSEFIVYLSEGSEIVLVEDYRSLEKADEEQLFMMSQSIVVKDNSRLKHIQIQDWNNQTVHVTAKLTKLQSYANYTSYFLLQGGEMTRINSKILLEGRGAEGYDLFAQFGIGNQRIDVKSELVHIAEDTIGQTHSRTVVVDRAESVLRGLIHIPKSGKNADSWLTSHGLTVGRGSVTAIPALMIDQNEVVAAHSAAVEPLNQEKLFYVESRGIPKEEAKAILIKGYFEPLSKFIPNEDLKEYIRNKISEKWDDYSESN
ncbi:MAG: SufD family Fe-S cluster assembly protein [Methanobacteriota archaeon]|nr:MAG: SufD family Fe-S cluster assembly protein [Euryarchaeota archaeon]